VAAGIVLVGCHDRDEIREPPCAGPPWSARERVPDVVWVETAQVLGALDGVAQRAAFESGGEVDDRARRGGDGRPSMTRASRA
jgi:hypothetical protein